MDLWKMGEVKEYRKRAQRSMDVHGQFQWYYLPTWEIKWTHKKTMTHWRIQLNDWWPNLIDLDFNGQIYTWCNNRRWPDRVCERLDIALSNTQWTTTFPRSKVTTEPTVGLDRSPLIIMTNLTDYQGRKHFRFKEMWYANQECMPIIKQACEK